MALEVSDKRDIAIAMFFVGAALVQQSEDSKRALSLLEQSFSISQEIDEPFWQARSFLMLGEFLVQEAKLNYHDAYLQSIALARTAGERLFFADTLSDYAHWLFRNNRVEEAKKYAEEADGLYKQIGSEQHSLTPFLLGDIAWSNGDTQTAKLLFIGIHQRFSLLGEKGFRSNSAGRLGLLAMEESDLDRARVYLEEALTIEREAGWRPWEAYYLIELGNLFYLQGNSEYFRQYVREGFALKPYFSDSHKALVLMTILGSLYFKKPDMSTRLLGAMNTPDRASDFPRTLVEKRYCVRAEAHARKVLGDAAFEALFAEGQKMSLDDGLDLALKIVEEM